MFGEMHLIRISIFLERFKIYLHKNELENHCLCNGGTLIKRITMVINIGWNLSNMKDNIIWVMQVGSVFIGEAISVVWHLSSWSGLWPNSGRSFEKMNNKTFNYFRVVLRIFYPRENPLMRPLSRASGIRLE